MKSNLTNRSMQAKRAAKRNTTPSIESILKDEGLDKYTDKTTTHSYGAIYQKLFNELTLEKNPSVLEIGVNFGGSILLWQKMIQEGSIVGIDIENRMPTEIAQKLDNSMVHLLFADAYSSATVDSLREKFGCEFDLIIDDGPHALQSQCSFAEKYLTMLGKHGVAVIEDIQEESWIEKIASFIPGGMNYEVVDLRAAKGRYDDLMMIIRPAK